MVNRQEKIGGWLTEVEENPRAARLVMHFPFTGHICYLTVDLQAADHLHVS